MSECRDDCEGHDHPHERSIHTSDFGDSVTRCNSPANPPPTKDKQEKYAGPYERYAEVHENSYRCRLVATVERIRSQYHRRNSLEKTRHRGVVEGYTQDAGEKSVGEAGD